jgi:hypothetical protein
MFETLDDPTPVAPAARHHVAVAKRAAELRRRRRTALALPAAALFLVALGAGALALRHDPADSSIAMRSTVTEAPEQVDLRGEVLVVAGARVIEDETRNQPTSGSFQRLVRFDLPGEGTAAVMRTELTTDAIADLLARTGATPGGTSPGGRPYYVRPDDPTQVLWLPADDLVVAVNASEGASPVAVLDALRYEPPTERCVDGLTVTSTPPCDPFDALLDGGGE